MRYNEFGELDFYSTTAGTTVYRANYERDGLGRIVSNKEEIEGTDHEYVYSYDSNRRLESVTRDGEIIESYAYDLNGNRVYSLSSTGIVHSDSLEIDAQERLTRYGLNSYQYADSGELTLKTENGGVSTAYNYDNFGNLTKVTLPNENVIEYIADAQHRRVGKIINGSLVQGFLYQDQLNPIAELDGNGNLVARFVYGTHSNVPDYMIKGDTVYLIVSDHIGSPRLVINSESNEVVQRLDFDSYGNVLLDSNPGFQPFGFAGGIYDLDTSLVRFGARDYDPHTGRWTTKDPIGFSSGAFNLYSYVDNDPINWIDTTGLAKGGKQNISSDEFAGWTDEEVAEQARSNDVTKEERRKAQKEEKARKKRNEQKRKENEKKKRKAKDRNKLLQKCLAIIGFGKAAQVYAPSDVRACDIYGNQPEFCNAL